MMREMESDDEDHGCDQEVFLLVSKRQRKRGWCYGSDCFMDLFKEDKPLCSYKELVGPSKDAKKQKLTNTSTFGITLPAHSAPVEDKVIPESPEKERSISIRARQLQGLKNLTAHQASSSNMTPGNLETGPYLVA